MAVRVKGGRYTVEFEQAGIRVFRRCPPATTRAQALALETKLRQEIFDQRNLDRVPDLSLETIVDLWLRDKLAGKKDQRMPRQNAEHLRPFLRGKSVRDVQALVREMMAKWSGTETQPKNSGYTPSGKTATSSQRGTLDRGICTPQTSSVRLSPATINRRLAVLKAALHYAWAQGWVTENVSGKISRLQEPPGREVYLTREQVKALAGAMESAEGKAAVMLLAYTGMRAGELLSLMPSDVSKDSLTVRQSKSGKPRVVPLPAIASGFLSALPCSLSYSQLQWQFRAARKAVGLDHVRLHDLRHTCASWLVNSGADLFVVGKILGHSTPVTTARYAHLAQETLRKAMGRLR